MNPSPAIASAVRFLLAHQSPDGAWRSDTYGVFKNGDALTPLALLTLLELGLGAEPAVRRGLDYLAAMARPDGTIDEGPFGLAYPAYTSALTVRVLNSTEDPAHRKAQTAWLAYLKARQLSAPLGWQPSDVEYGGWGYAHGLPRKPPPGQPVEPLTLPNLSATAFAVEALRSAGPADDTALTRALRFICRCQNYSESEAALDDGGFFFVHGDPPRNKAGESGTDHTGRPRYASYGSTTADGLRALLACGLPLDHERVTAARRWLERNFSASAHPGQFAPGRAAVQAAVYFYYCWSAAHALRACGVQQVETPAGPVRWAEALAGELLRRQRPDGSWINDAVEVREDDPVVATALALGALAPA
ncbi:MAG: hypothetical protein L0Z62_17130 [Gemmataceae bacterium]|nr:hypothetical protein [Gemmataceae bacterium]